VSVVILALAAPTSGRAANSPVADAVMKGDRALLVKLLQQKADVNASQVDGATALHWAVYRDDLDAANQLLRAGARVDAANVEHLRHHSARVEADRDAQQHADGRRAGHQVCARTDRPAAHCGGREIPERADPDGVRLLQPDLTAVSR
jgi:hypothetical protein